MKINHFSRLSNTSPRMLRHYEKIGLLEVSRSDSTNNYREYSAKELQKVAQIKTLQNLGFSLTTIKTIFETENPKELHAHFEEQKTILEEATKKLITQQTLLNQISDVLVDDTRYLDYNVVQKVIPERQVMSLRRVVTDYAEEGDMWKDLYTEFLAQDVTFSTPPLGLSIYHDEAFEEGNIDIEIQSSIVGDYQNTSDILFKTVPKTQVASVTFNGSFEQMPLIMEALGFWIEANDFTIAGPMINIFHVTASQDENPDNWITEACLVVAPKEAN